MRNGNVPLFDIDVRSAILAHRAEFDQMTIRCVIGNRIEHVQRTDDIIDMGEHSVLTVDHRIGSAPLLTEMDNRLRLKITDDRLQEGVVTQIANERCDDFARQLTPDGNALLERLNRRQTFGAKFVIPETPREVVKNGDLVATL